MLGIFVKFPLLVGLVLRLVSSHKAKESVLKYFFGGMSEARLYELGAAYCKEKMKDNLRPKAMERLSWHQEQGHRCILVTASMSFWTRAWAEQHKMELIATHGEIIDGRFTGKLDGLNCNGRQKVIRLKAFLQEEPVNYKYAYGNTKGDQAMLDWADEAGYRVF